MPTELPDWKTEIHRENVITKYALITPMGLGPTLIVYCALVEKSIILALIASGIVIYLWLRLLFHSGGK